MNSINAYFSGADVYFSGSRSYRNNQILVEYLKKVSEFDLDEMLEDFLLLIKQLELSYDMQYDNVVNYYKHSQKLERVINNIERSATLFLVKNIFSFVLAVVSLIFTMPYPFSAAQLSLVSSLTAGFPAFAPVDVLFQHVWLGDDNTDTETVAAKMEEAACFAAAFSALMRSFS